MAKTNWQERIDGAKDVAKVVKEATKGLEGTADAVVTAVFQHYADTKGQQYRGLRVGGAPYKMFPTNTWGKWRDFVGGLPIKQTGKGGKFLVPDDGQERMPADSLLAKLSV